MGKKAHSESCVIVCVLSFIEKCCWVGRKETKAGRIPKRSRLTGRGRSEEREREREGSDGGLMRNGEWKEVTERQIGKRREI